MKKITLFFAFMAALSFSHAQGLEGIVVEKYYLSDAADSVNASNIGAVSDLKAGSVTYRVFVDMAPGYQFVQMFGNTTFTTQAPTVIHPLIIKTTTNFYNDPNNGVSYGPQANSVTNTKKNTTLIDSWLSVGGVCAGKMGVLKTEDTDGSIGNSQGILTNNPGGLFGAAINSVVTGARDGLAPGTPIAPTALGLNGADSVFDQSVGNSFLLTNGAIAGLGGVVGVTPSNMVLIGQFTTHGVFSFSLNIQLSDTATNTSEVYVPNNAQSGETTYTALAYSSAATTTTTPDTTVAIKTLANELTTLSIYPNPSKGIFTITATNVKESTANSYSVFDVTGKLVFTKNLGKTATKFSETVDISGYNSGLYFLNVTLDGIVSTRKIVKE